MAISWPARMIALTTRQSRRLRLAMTAWWASPVVLTRASRAGVSRAARSARSMGAASSIGIWPSLTTRSCGLRTRLSAGAGAGARAWGVAAGRVRQKGCAAKYTLGLKSREVGRSGRGAVRPVGSGAVMAFGAVLGGAGRGALRRGAAGGAKALRAAEVRDAGTWIIPAKRRPESPG